MTGVKIMFNKKTLSAQEIADWANSVHKIAGGKGNPFVKEMYIPHDEKENQYRLSGHLCDCGCEENLCGKPSKGEFELLPLSDEAVQQGGKAYMVCQKCGGYSHL